MAELICKGGMCREILPLSIIALMFAIAFYAEPLVNANELGQIATHFDFSGKANGWMGKTVGVYIMPILTLVIYIGLLLIPKVEVYQHNLEEFALHFWGFKVILVFVMAIIYVAMLIPNMSSWTRFDPIVIILPAIAMLFFYVGYMLNFTKRNFFIGVRTPWTLTDEKVWAKTNKMAGELFWVCGALTLVSLVATADLRLWFVLLPVIFTAIAATVYSFWEYRKTKRGQKGKPRGKKRKR